MGIFDWFGKKEQQNDDLEERLQQSRGRGKNRKPSGHRRIQ